VKGLGRGAIFYAADASPGGVGNGDLEDVFSSSTRATPLKNSDRTGRKALKDG